MDLDIIILLKHIWIGIVYFLLNFFATFVSVLGLQITVTFGSVLGLQITDCRLHWRLTLDCSHQYVGSHMLQAQCCAALSQPKKESKRRSSA